LRGIWRAVECKKRNKTGKEFRWGYSHHKGLVGRGGGLRRSFETQCGKREAGKKDPSF
jgi:hypothetical protein